MEFSEVFREERYYCNQLFRLLCHNKETDGLHSGLGAILEELGMLQIAQEEEVREAQIYTEVSVFRDVFGAETDKDSFTDHLYETV